MQLGSSGDYSSRLSRHALRPPDVCLGTGDGGWGRSTPRHLNSAFRRQWQQVEHSCLQPTRRHAIETAAVAELYLQGLGQCLGRPVSRLPEGTCRCMAALPLEVARLMSGGSAAMQVVLRL